MAKGLFGEFAKLVGDRPGEVPTRPTRKHYEINAASEADETPENIRGLKSTRCTAWSRRLRFRTCNVCPTDPHDTIVEEDGKHQLQCAGASFPTGGSDSWPGCAGHGLTPAASWMTTTPGHGPTPGGGTEVGGHLTPWGSDAHVHSPGLHGAIGSAGRPKLVKTTRRGRSAGSRRPAISADTWGERCREVFAGIVRL